jgi:hypothetical protein
MPKKKEIWKIRSVKSYPEAHNHIIVGEVLEKDTACVRVKGRSYHFGRRVAKFGDIRVGPLTERIVTCSRVEIINVLPSTFDYAEAKLIMEEDGSAVLDDGSYRCPLFLSYDDNY